MKVLLDGLLAKEYMRGLADGKDEGWFEGYNEGYNEGYRDGSGLE